MINIHFIPGLKRSRRWHDSRWVIVDKMTKSAHFLLVKTTNSTEDYGVLILIISDTGAQVTALFRKSFQKDFRSRLNLTIGFHPQMDG